MNNIQKIESRFKPYIEEKIEDEYYLFLLGLKKGYALIKSYENEGKLRSLKSDFTILCDFASYFRKRREVFCFSFADSTIKIFFGFISFSGKEIDNLIFVFKILGKKFKKEINLKENNYIINFEIGKFLGFPKCCYEKYAEENYNSHNMGNSYERYFKQLKELKVNNVFKIKRYKNDYIYSFLGHVPCSPKCEKSLELLEKINKLKNVI